MAEFYCFMEMNIVNIGTQYTFYSVYKIKIIIIIFYFINCIYEDEAIFLINLGIY